MSTPAICLHGRQQAICGECYPSVAAPGNKVLWRSVSTEQIIEDLLLRVSRIEGFLVPSFVPGADVEMMRKRADAWLSIKRAREAWEGR